MSTLPGTELRKAIFERLETTGFGVHWNVPYELEGYYYVIGDSSFPPWNTKFKIGYEAHVTIHAWDARTNARSAEKVEELNDAAVEALTTAIHETQNYLTMDSFTVVRQDLENNNTFADGTEMPHGVVEMQFLIEQK